MVLMHYLVDFTVIEVSVSNTMDAHEILDYAISQLEGIDLCACEMFICHFKCMLTLLRQGLCDLRRVPINHAMCLVFPVEINQAVTNLLLYVVVYISE